MAGSRVLRIASRMAATQCRNFFLFPPRHHLRFSLLHTSTKVPALHPGLGNIVAFLHCRMSTSVSPEKDQGTSVENKGANGNVDAANQTEDADAKNVKDSQETQSSATSKAQSASQSGKRRRQVTKRTAFSDSDSEGELDDLSREDLVKLLLEKEKVLRQKQNEFAAWKDKFLRSYADMENVMDRTRRDAESSKKFAVQNFAKSLLDVADNLSRASSVTKESFNKLDASDDTVGAVPLLKTLLEGVELTEKQLAEAFRKSGVEKYDPTNEQFDPNRHNAVFQVPDNNKPPSTVAVVLKGIRWDFITTIRSQKRWKDNFGTEGVLLKTEQSTSVNCHFYFCSVGQSLPTLLLSDLR